MRRRKPSRRRPRHLGAPPGFIAPSTTGTTSVRVIRYDDKTVDELDSLPTEGGGVTWIDVVGLGNTEVIQEVGDRVDMHPLALEDACSPHQRAKFEEYDDGLFVVVRMPRVDAGVLDVEQISIFLTDDAVVTFQERDGDCFEPVRQRIRKSQGRIRTQGATYLAYALLDASVDGMFPLLETFEDRLEALDEKLFVGDEPDIMPRIHQLERDLMTMRRTVIPLREALNRLARHEHRLLDDDVRLYLRDCHDHLSQQVDLLDGQRDLAKSQMDAVLSHLGHRSNEVMKVLTMIATLFIPLSFIAGLYGMNFDTRHPANMPELQSPWGYVGVVSVMVAIALAMLWFFRRKRWL